MSIRSWTTARALVPATLIAATAIVTTGVAVSSAAPAPVRHASPAPAGNRSAHAATGPGEVRALAPGESFIAGVGAHWLAASQATLPAGANLAAAAPAAAAISFAERSGLPAQFSLGSTPEASLTVFSNDVKGEAQPDGTVKLDDQNVLAWVLRYPNAPIVRHGPATKTAGQPVGPSRCDFFIVVNSEAGALLEAFQSCNRKVG